MTPCTRKRAFVTGVALVVAFLILPVAWNGEADDHPTFSGIPVFWSLQPIRLPAIPKPTHLRWGDSPIDAFIAEKIENSGLAPSPEANRFVLLRRATFDLTGLPPTPEEIDAFHNNRRGDAFARLIDRLLESPRYGERWGRHWLDVARYADTAGFESDLSYDGAWKYRDYVIRSFNANKRFDRFITEQVAGDELWPESDEARAATGLYAVGPVADEAAMISNQLDYDWLTDSVDTTGAAFLGMTMGCARCHNHKYDPITQQDYYGMQAVFAASDRPYPPKTRERQIKALNNLVAEKPLPKELENDPRCTLRTEKEVGTRLFHISRPREVHVLRRGELSKPREAAVPGIPVAFVLGKANRDFSNHPPDRRRAALAGWLTSPDANPLTARVIVNRVWGWHFGAGLVRTPSDFGRQGEAPTHPELLDWLANDFVAHGWDLKRLHRQIMLSATYRMRSEASEASARIDPDNRWLSHFPRQRLEAEMIWDSLHACAGQLNLKAFGPPVVPPLSKDELTGLFGADEKWRVTKDPSEHNRRAVYLLVRRTYLAPVLEAFDSPDLMASCPRRLETIVPTQALALLNSNVAAEESRAMAARLTSECGDDPEKYLPRAWLLAFGRPITRLELARAREFLRRREDELGSEKPAKARKDEALNELCLGLFNANEFIFVD